MRISQAESIDAMRTVAKLGLSDRALLQDALLLTLAKSEEEKELLRSCFELFFAGSTLWDRSSETSGVEDAGAVASSQEAAGGQEDLGPLAQMLLSGDGSAIMAAIANASAAASLSDISYFTQRGLFSSRILDLLGIQRLNADFERLAEADPATAEQLSGSVDGLRETVGRVVSQALQLYGREETEKLRNRILKNTPLVRIEQRQLKQMRALIKQIARRLRDRHSRPRKRPRWALLDVRRTLRKNAAWGNVPFRTAWKRKHRERPKIIALCDMSGSVARVSEFFLLLIHSLHEVVFDVRSFAFSGHVTEVSDILEKRMADQAMQEIISKVGLGSSDYGTSFSEFERQWMTSVTAHTTVIVLGDARTNNLEPRADILRRISERARRVVWLNPESLTIWGSGDSEMPRYATFCNVVRQCATVRQLERAISDVVAS